MKKSELAYITHLAETEIGVGVAVEAIATILAARTFLASKPELQIKEAKTRFEAENILPHALVKQMHVKFGIQRKGKKPTRLSVLERDFRVKAMREEAQELEDAKNIEDQADAFLDMIVFALGGLEKMGLIDKYPELMAEVMRANMDKEVANSESKSKRGYKLDLIKPKGWTPPNLTPIINS